MYTVIKRMSKIQLVADLTYTVIPDDTWAIRRNCSQLAMACHGNIATDFCIVSVYMCLCGLCMCLLYTCTCVFVHVSLYMCLYMGHCTYVLGLCTCVCVHIHVSCVRSTWDWAGSLF